jgi:autotransporter-associated beta strand protein
MKPKSTLRSFLLGCSSLLVVSNLHAADGTWTQTTAGPFNWDDIANWNSGAGPIADLADSTANFTANINPAQTVNLNNPKTIGNITFTDSTTSSHDLTISGANILTLDRTDATKPTIDVTQSGRTLTISSVIGGGDGMLKSGAGAVTLSGNNTYSGGTDVSAGKINVGHNNAFGSGTVTVSGNSTIDAVYGAFPLMPNALQVNSGVTLTTAGSTQYFGMTFSGPVSGSGTIQTGGSGNDANTREKLGLYSDANDFTGSLVNKGGSAIIKVNSLGDGGKIQLYDGTGGLELGSGTATPLLFNTRQVELFGSSVISNNNATATNTITINTDLAVGSTGNKTFTLAGSNTGDNTYGGIIADGNFSAATQVVSLTKAGAGKWILTGANTYTGNTTIADGMLEIRGAGQLGGGNYAGSITSTDATPSPFTFASSASQTLSGVISGTMEVIKDGAGSLSLTGSAIHTGGTTVTAGTLSLGDGTNNANLNDFSTLSVAGGAVLNLNYSGSDTVFFLNLGGSPAAAGEWGATGSGAANESPLITGTGRINNVAGVTSSFGIAYWDGGTDNIVGDGNAISSGGAGTWDTVIQNWDVGATAHTAWLNTSTAKAVFGGAENANRTVTVTGPLNIKELSFETTGSSGTRYIIDGGTLNFGAGGMIRTADNRYDQTITSAITGSPAVETKDSGAGNTYLGLVFAPGSGTQTLGNVLHPNNTGIYDKAGFTMAGSTTGNSVGNISYAGTDQYGTVYKKGASTWTTGNITTGVLDINGSGGTLIINGTATAMYSGFVYTAGTLSGNASLRRNDRRGNHDFLSGFIVAPGNGVGTITVLDGTVQTPTAAQQFTIFRAGSIYEWQVGPASQDTVHIAAGKLQLDGFTLKILDAGGAPGPADQLPVVTYDPAKVTTRTLSLGAVVIDTAGAPGWDKTGATLVDDGAGTIYLTGLDSGGTPASPYDTWATGFGLQDPWLGVDPLLNGEAGANPDGDAFTNLKEFAFAFNPTVSDGGGTLTISGGAITQNGPPQIYVDPVTGQYFLRYTRRTDYVAAGLTYTAQFAADSLGTGSFEDVAGGSVVGTGTGAGAVAIEAVSIEFPDALPVSGKKARFGRVEVSLP